MAIYQVEVNGKRTAHKTKENAFRFASQAFRYYNDVRIMRFYAKEKQISKSYYTTGIHTEDSRWY